MIANAWNNGKHHQTGAGYGLKVNKQDRDQYFKRNWKSVFLQFEKDGVYVEVNIEKKSFWNSTCRELISKEIGLWLIKNGLAPWGKGYPPKLKLEHLYDNRFKVSLIDV